MWLKHANRAKTGLFLLLMKNCMLKGRVSSHPYFLAEEPPNQIKAAKFGPNWCDFLIQFIRIWMVFVIVFQRLENIP